MTDGVKQVSVHAAGDCYTRTGRHDMRIPAQVMILNRIMPGGGAVVAAKPIAPVIPSAALLREAGLRLEHASVGIHPEVPPADVNGRAGRIRLLTPAATSDGARFAFDNAAEQAVCAVDPVVQAETQAVDASLVIAGCKTGEELFDNISAAIAIRVLRKENIRSGANEGAFAPGGHARSEG